MPSLPDPTSGVFLEVSFRRLLKSCKEITEGDTKGREDFRDWRSSPVFHHYVETLQEQLADLRVEGAKRIPSNLFDEYELHVSDIAKQIRPAKLPAYCRPPLHATHVKDSLSAVSTEELVSSAPAGGALPGVRLAAVEMPSASGRVQQQEVQDQRPALGKLTATTKEVLDRQQNLQDNLTDEMVALAAGLKRNAQAMQQSVAQRGTLLEETDETIEKNLAAAQTSVKRAKEEHTRGKRSFWMTCFIILAVCLTLAGAVLFIRLTRAVGYRATPRITANAEL